MLVIVSLDKMFVERESHETQLRKSRTPLSTMLCEGRSQALTALKNPQAQMIYFYCHGGITANNTPYLNIGNEEYITPDNLRAYKIRWESPRPLVFLNGCMTTALEPEKAIEFVSAFVNQAAASGVIGTEITVFEPLATEFAEAFMKYFMGDCKSIGLSNLRGLHCCSSSIRLGWFTYRLPCPDCTWSTLAEYTPLYRLEDIFARHGFEISRATQSVWCGDAADLVEPLYQLMAERVRASHVVSTDDTFMPKLSSGKTANARMSVYVGDEDHPYNIFDSAEPRPRRSEAFPPGLRRCLQRVQRRGGRNGIVRAGCWASLRRKIIGAEKTPPESARQVATHGSRKAWRLMYHDLFRSHY